MANKIKNKTNKEKITVHQVASKPKIKEVLFKKEITFKEIIVLSSILEQQLREARKEIRYNTERIKVIAPEYKEWFKTNTIEPQQEQIEILKKLQKKMC